MLRLYCLPGRAFAELAYLFPASGKVWASARQRESRIAHFIFSTMFYCGAIMLLFSVVGPKSRPKPVKVDQQSSANPMMEDTQPQIQEPVIARRELTVPAEPEEDIRQEGESALQVENNDESSATASTEQLQVTDNVKALAPEQTALVFTPEEEALINNPRQSAAVREAIEAASSIGVRQKWEDGRLSGWASPSASTNTSCTLVSYTIDQVSQERQPYDPAVLCN